MNLNMLAGAFLGTVFVVMTLGIVSDALFHQEVPEQQGFAIALPDGTGASDTASDEPTGPDPVAPMMASAEMSEGESEFRKCASCHNVEAGAGNKTGPNLYNIVGADIASNPDFGYSAALVAYGEGKTWGYEELNGFLAKPKDWVPGTSMGFAGVRKVEDRANLIAYLAANTENPPPLPDPAAATEETAEAAAEEAPAEEMSSEGMESEGMTSEEAPAEEMSSEEMTAEEAPAEEAAPAEDGAADDGAAESDAATGSETENSTTAN